MYFRIGWSKFWWNSMFSLSIILCKWIKKKKKFLLDQVLTNADLFILPTFSFFVFLTDLSSFKNLCSTTKATINSTLHLISNENATLFDGCECRVNGSFTLILNDVRLNAKKSELCSPAEINVQFLTSSTLYLCKNESHSYFQYGIEMTPRRMIAFKTNSDEVPEMVWLTLKPKSK